MNVDLEDHRPTRDRVLNVVFAVGTAVVAVGLGATIVVGPIASGDQGVEDWAQLAVTTANLLFLALVTVLLVERHRPTARATGILPRLTAIAGSFLLVPTVILTDVSDHAVPVVGGLGLTTLGVVAATYTLGHLGRSFSVMAEARELVRSGPYRTVRHPLYVAEQVAALGIVISHASFIAAAAFVVQIALQVRRALNEEATLTTAFPEYREYAASTARFIPGLH